MRYNALAGYGSRINEIIILCRNKSLGKLPSKKSEQPLPIKNSPHILCDLSRLNDVKSHWRNTAQNTPYLDAIFINAGIGYAQTYRNWKMAWTRTSRWIIFRSLCCSCTCWTCGEINAGRRVIFNVIEHGKIYWDDLQLTNGWVIKKCCSVNAGKEIIHSEASQLYAGPNMPALSFIGFEIPKLYGQTSSI